MKRKSLSIGIFLVFTILVVISCKKQLAVEDIKISLQNELSFRNYVARGIQRKVELSTYLMYSLPKSTIPVFQNAVLKIAEPTEASFKSVFSQYSLNFVHFNRLIQTELADQAKLLEKIPTLRSLSEEELQSAILINYNIVARQFVDRAKLNYSQGSNGGGEQKIIASNSVKLKKQLNDEEMQSGIIDDFDFETAYNLIPTDMSESEIQGVADNALGLLLSATTGGSPGHITIGELGTCIIAAVAAPILSLTALGGVGKMLTDNNVSGAIVTVTKFSIKNSGWVAAISIAATFATCMINAYEG